MCSTSSPPFFCSSGVSLSALFCARDNSCYISFFSFPTFLHLLFEISLSYFTVSVVNVSFFIVTRLLTFKYFRWGAGMNPSICALLKLTWWNGFLAGFFFGVFHRYQSLYLIRFLYPGYRLAAFLKVISLSLQYSWFGRPTFKGLGAYLPMSSRFTSKVGPIVFRGALATAYLGMRRFVLPAVSQWYQFNCFSSIKVYRCSKPLFFAFLYLC